MIPPVPQYRYIGSFKKLPESAEERDIVLVGNTLYFWRDAWHVIIDYGDNLLNRMITKIREAKDNKLKRELEKLIGEEYEFI